MKVGVDATCWQNARGYGRHARSLLGSLVKLDEKNEYTFFLDSNHHTDSLPSRIAVQYISTSKPASLAASANGHRSLQDMWRMSRAMSSSEFDVLLFPTVYSYVPVLSRAKKIVIIHDVIAEKYPELTLPNPLARFFWKTKVALGRWQADSITTVSDFSRKCLIEHFKLSPEAVSVVGEASDPVFRVLPDAALTKRLRDSGINDRHRHIVYVGGFSPHKNLTTLVEAFSKLVSQSAFSDVRLVMVGEDKKEVFHSYLHTIKKQIEELNLSDKVIFTGFLPDEELVVLLNISDLFVLPSLLEGFGLPAVEAAACGCPVIATSESPLPQLLGEGGLYLDPNKGDELSDLLSQVLSSETLRYELKEEGLRAVSRLTWDAAAKQMMELIRNLTTNQFNS